jgi:GDP-L-fucose synthase
MNILCTSSDSFIGKNINPSYYISKFDLTNYNEVFNFLNNKIKIDGIIHCAAKHGSSIEMKKNHIEYIQNNFLCDLNVLKACVQFNIKNTLMMSSITCFPVLNKEILTEDDIFDGPVNTSIFGYAASKRNTIDICKAFNLENDINATAVLLGNCYGKYGKYNTNTIIIHKLIYDIDCAIKTKSDLILSGDGEDVRTFLYAGDLDAIFKDIIFKNLKTHVVLSSPDKITIKELTYLIAKKMNYKGNIIFDNKFSSPHKTKIAKSNILNIEKYSLTSLDVGLDKTIEYYFLTKKEQQYAIL